MSWRLHPSGDRKSRPFKYDSSCLAILELTDPSRITYWQWHHHHGLRAGPEAPPYLFTIPYVPEPELPAVVSPTADSPGYIPESDPEGDPEEEDEEDPEEDPAYYPAWGCGGMLGYGITDTWDGLETTIMHGLMEDARDDRSELRGRVNLLYSDRPIHHHLAVMVEREAWMAREAWGFSWNVSDDARSHVCGTSSTVVEQRALISGLQAADHQRQVQLTMALKLLKGLQTQMAEFQRQQGPAEGPAQPDAPEEADDGTYCWNGHVKTTTPEAAPCHAMGNTEEKDDCIILPRGGRSRRLRLSCGILRLRATICGHLPGTNPRDSASKQEAKHGRPMQQGMLKGQYEGPRPGVLSKIPTPTKDEDKSKGKRLARRAVVREFPRMFFLRCRTVGNEGTSGATTRITDKGFIRPSSSPWGAPVLFVKKKDGFFPDVYTDYREFEHSWLEYNYLGLVIDWSKVFTVTLTMIESIKDCASPKHKGDSPIFGPWAIIEDLSRAGCAPILDLPEERKILSHLWSLREEFGRCVGGQR
ncbi:hypothetical protein Tco_1134317 [Tanacetum coccineum]